ncbi:MAG: permease, partial [Deltaproteobacteria bacterium]|nr:permease [Deltaproteobacteria bacterium]
MLIPTVIMGILALILFAMGYFKGEGQHITGMKSALSMTIEIIPLLIFAFIIAGMVQVLISQETIARWVGTESGMRGI